MTRKVDHTWHGRIHDGQPSSGITDLHAHCLEGKESSSEWGWGLPDHAQHVRERAVLNTWVSTWTAKSLT